MRRLRQDLSLRLMLPVLAVVVFTALLGVFGAQHHVDTIFDSWLLDAARSLAAQVHFIGHHAQVNLSAQSEALLTYDVVDSTSFEVLEGQQFLLGNPGIPQSGQREKSYGPGESAYDARYGGHDVRVVQVEVKGPNGAVAKVLVAETLIKRGRARTDLLWTMAPAAILVLLAAYIVGSAVRRTIGTLERIATGWNQQSHASLQPVLLDDVPDELMLFASALNDLLERVRAMLERERQFAATVAHQLRTPLAGLRLGMARAAQATDVASMRLVLNELGDTTQRTARLVQQLLLLSRLDPEVKAGMHLAPVAVAKLVEEIGETYLEAALQKGVEIELESTTSTDFVQGVPELLGEALGNLIDNAIRYTPTGGRILISIATSPTRISVSDSGPGIPQDERETVVQRFVRGSTSRGEGTGLGFAIVKEIVMLHNATLSIGTGDLGGACVTIEFEAGQTG